MTIHLRITQYIIDISQSNTIKFCKQQDNQVEKRRRGFEHMKDIP